MTTNSHTDSPTDSPAENQTRSLTQRFKEDNWDLHQIAEHAPEGPSRLIRGEVSRSEYAESLQQEYLHHRALDEAVGRAIDARPDLAPVVEGTNGRAPAIAEDLAFFQSLGEPVGDPGTAPPTPGVTRFLEHIGASSNDPMAILGLHYVRTGATNGNRFVAKKVRAAMDLPADTDQGTRHLDPWGAEQRPRWMAFKERLDALELTPDEQDRCFNAVRSMYVYAINMNASEHRSADALLREFGGGLDKAQFDRDHAVPAHPAG
ncbi:MAG: biliverdin-producing heme oxygenase [Planctomycetota bacterium]